MLKLGVFPLLRLSKPGLCLPLGLQAKRPEEPSDPMVMPESAESGEASTPALPWSMSRDLLREALVREETHAVRLQAV